MLGFCVDDIDKNESTGIRLQRTLASFAIYLVRGSEEGACREV